MPFAGLHYFPVTLPFILVFLLLASIVITLIEIGVIQYASVKMGLNRRFVFGILLFSLLGSYVNIPVAEFPAKHVIVDREMTYFGMHYVVPVVEELPRTVLALNIGGAVIPILLSAYLIVKKGMYGRTLLGIAIVAAVVHWLAHPIPGMGIAVPIFIPPVVAAVTALLLARQSAPSLAYICGSLGTLIGADLLNLDIIRESGAPIASIGGAGTFDSIFLTGLLAVLLA
jgi:uncharacterized membrane protein